MVICSLQNVEISSLLGHFVVVWVWHSLQVALNIAPLLTKSLNLEQRVETAVSGFVSIDSFRCPGNPEVHEIGVAYGQLLYGRADDLQPSVGLPGCHCDRSHKVSGDESMEIRKLQSCRARNRAILWNPSQPKLYSSIEL